MSALAMILTAAMAVPGNGPGMEFGEIERGLDLRGEWRGTFCDEDGRQFRARYASQDGLLIARTGTDEIGWAYNFEAVDEGNGRFRTAITARKCLGVYEWRGDSLLLCYRDAGAGYPTAFRGRGGQFLLILHRVKSRK